MDKPDLTKLTLAELRRDAMGDGGDPYAAVEELHRRAQANALVQAERDEFDEELHTCRAIVGATSEHLHVDLEELVDKLRRTEADSRSWQELATARAQANDRLRSAAQWVATAERDLQESFEAIDGFANAKIEQLQERCGALRAALAAAPAAPPTPAAPVTCPECDGSGTVEKCDWPGEHANRYQEPCPKGCKIPPAAPVTDAEIEAAFEAFSRDVYGHAAGAFMGVDSDADDERPGVAARRSKDALRALIARRVASAGAAPVDSEREAAIETWRVKATCFPCGGYSFDLSQDEIDEAVRLMRSAPPAPAGDQDAKLRELLTWADGWSRSDKHGPEWRTAFECVAGQVRFLLGGNAADALSASAIAAAPEAPAWLEKLRVATNRMVDAAGYAASSLLSDVDIDLKDVRDFAFALREQVESHASRIEALERAAQEGGQ